VSEDEWVAGGPPTIEEREVAATDTCHLNVDQDVAWLTRWLGHIGHDERA
jgi:hypothetical protein